MKALVVFRTAEGRYALDVERTGGVVEIGDVQPLPDPRPGVCGLVTVGGELIPLLDVLDATGEQAVVVRAGDRRLALRVAEVTGVVKPGAGGVQPAPDGQATEIVVGVLPGAGDALVLDPVALVRKVRS